MPIKPIDIMKSHEVTQLKSFEHNRVQNEQAHINKQFQDTIRADQKKTTGTEKGENKEFRYDAKEKGQNSYSNPNGKHQGKKDESKEEKKTGTGLNQSGRFDVLI